MLMIEQATVIDQLENVLASRDLTKRGEVLRRVADLFVQGSGKFSDEQIDLFDDVMSMLVEKVELAARVAFGSRLARVSDAPPEVMRKLAFDDVIEVAAPILTHSTRLDEPTLVANARSKGQGHLLAISKRVVLTEPVTDVLVIRGDREVVASTATNRGAKFSASGLSALVSKAGSDGELAMCIWSRPDIPRHELLNLFGRASAAVRRNMETANPRQAALIQVAVAEASEHLQAIARSGSHEHTDAVKYVSSLHTRGHLNEARLHGFAREGSFDATAVSLSLMCDLPLGTVERALVQSEPEQLLILAKAVDLSWDTTKAILTSFADRGAITKDRMDKAFASFFRLQLKTARAALQFYRLREKASNQVN
jgi:uncharacterized protein (DUF2336 family)